MAQKLIHPHRNGAGLPEVDVLPAVLRIGGGQLRVAEVGGDLEQAADDERQHQEQGAARRRGHLRQGRENTRTHRGAHAQGNDRAQAQLSAQLLLVFSHVTISFQNRLRVRLCRTGSQSLFSRVVICAPPLGPTVLWHQRHNCRCRS